MKELYILATELGFIPKNPLINWKNESYLWLCELQRWLREGHNIHVIVYFDKNTVNTYFYYMIFSIDGYVNKESNHTFKLYEEALEAGLFETLNLIK